MEITYRLHELTTGRPLSLPVHAPGRWQVSLSQRGSGTHSHVIPIASKFTPAQWHDSTLRWWHVLAEYWDGIPKYAGIIVDKHWSPRRQVLTCDTQTPDTLMQDRYPFGVGSYFTTSFGVSGVSVRGAVAAIIDRVTQDTNVGPPVSWRVPADIQALGEAGGYGKEFPNEDWRTAAQIISYLQKLPGGPDVAWVPKADENERLRWDVLLGSPRVEGPMFDLPLSVARSAVTDFTLHEYGRDMLSGLFVRGEGLDQRRPFGEARDAVGPPMATRDAARHEVGEDLDLDAIAAQQLERDRSGTEAMNLASVQIGSAPGTVAPAAMRLGARPNVRYSGDGYEEPFSRPYYVTSMSHDSASNPGFVNPEVQPL